LTPLVIDTSALLAIIFQESGCADCMEQLNSDRQLLISAGTLAEAEIVAVRRGVRPALQRLVTKLGLEIVAVGADEARLAADAYARWGKGMHPAALNYGDCFAYALAAEQNYPLLFIGNDFAQTDIQSALTPQ